MKEEEKE